MRSALFAAVLLAAAPAAAADWTPVWTLEGLADPESVALAPDGRSFFVANVAGEGDVKDGQGFISRVSRDGKLLEREWVRGLDAPKRAIVKGQRLFVSDITRLGEIDIPTAKVVGAYEAPDAKFLNDVAVAPDGTVLVADSATARILALQDGRIVPWSADPQLRAVNGLLPERHRLLVTTTAGKLLAFDWKSRAATVLAEGLGDGDGVAPAGDGAYFVSEWPGRLFRVSPDGKAETLIDSRKAGTYINDFIRVGDLLVVPSWKPGRLAAYRVAP
ncbi:hypothetical protein [Phenylobacterium sp.]|uniref:SMP-30/gluconolactonase/LRE family protein n=1 Tax=Phenylobacterium sp. TaxID=1871053 RepID=UPI002810C747|nr:hypothetical protein [Phenylobacterium sp.]